jgi:Flp pilus assembly protein TadG
MGTGRERRRRRRSVGGQGLVEFAIVCPIAILLVLAILSGSWLFFQNEAVVDGSRGGARAASIASSLVKDDGTGTLCESGAPTTIAYAVGRAAPQLPVDQAMLCAIGGSKTHLQAKSPAAGKATVTVDAAPSLATPTSVTVTVSYSATGLAPPLTRTFTFSASSVQPVLQP